MLCCLLTPLFDFRVVEALTRLRLLRVQACRHGSL